MAKLSFSIREATEEDFKAVTKLYRESYQAHAQALPRFYKETPEFPISRGSFLNVLEDENEVFFVAEVNGKVVGMINASIEEESADRLLQAYRRVSVDELCVTEAFQTQGIGTALLKEAENWAKKQDIEEITLILYEFNDKARRFYVENGFKPFSVRLNKEL